jgi:N-acetylmuramoyl-L-alanine amidase
MDKCVHYGWWLFCLSSLFFNATALASTLTGVRVWPSPDETRVVLDMTASPKYTSFSLSSPNRFVIDLKGVSKSTAELPQENTEKSVLTKVRVSSPSKKGDFRLVMELNSSVKPTVFALPPNGNYGHRLVIDLPHAIATPPLKAPILSPMLNLMGEKPIIIALDPGHGGEDPGSPNGRLYEKDVVLAISKRVARKIDNTAGFKSVMIRTGDYFVSLNKRSEIARKNKANLLVSIHADGFHSPRPRGASVWVLSNRRASSEIGRWLEKHEEQSELLGGGDVLAKTDPDPYLSHTILDLQFQNSQREGYDVAKRVLKELKKVTTLHKAEPEHASFAVLKSPDIPSLLIETGFITNPTEARLLRQPAYQEKLANAIYQGILSYFDEKPLAGTLFASLKSGADYKVKKGDSLSVIANRYGTSTDNLKRFNQLKSASLAVGQVLKIPALGTLKSVTQQAKKVSKNPKMRTEKKTVTLKYKVKSGDMLSKIAVKYDVKMKDIRRWSKLKSDNIWIGQILTIKQVKTVKVVVATPKMPIKPKIVTYRVRSGDALSKIAVKYGVTLKELRSFNRLRSDELAIGQILKIPSS